MTRLLVAPCLAVALFLATVGCAGDDAGQWVREAEAAHASADRAVADGDLAAARRALEAFVNEPAPREVGAQEARVVRQDVMYRLARLSLEAGDAEAALRWADRGLALGRGDDVFTANLYVARGQAREALGQPTEAAADYHQALLINERLLDDLLEGESP